MANPSSSPPAGGSDPSPGVPTEVVGVDIGGTGVKAAVVDTTSGELVSERIRIPTPRPAVPEAVAATAAELVSKLDHPGPVGVTVPAVVSGGVVRTAANIDESWIDVRAAELFSGTLDRHCTVLNDADAAGMAEMRFGAGRGRGGVVVVVTLGTGIGTAVFTRGVLVPNTELGHLEMKGTEAEKYAAASVRESEDLSWDRWGRRVGRYMKMVERLLWPELIIVGGGVSKRFERFEEEMRSKAAGTAEIVPAASLNQAGIVGAALAARAEAAGTAAATGASPDVQGAGA